LTGDLTNHNAESTILFDKAVRGSVAKSVVFPWNWATFTG